MQSSVSPWDQLDRWIFFLIPFFGSFFAVALAVSSIVGHMSTPMFLAKVTVLTGARLLWNAIVFEVPLAFSIGSLLSVSIGFPRRFGGFLELLDGFESFNGVPQTLWNNSLGQVELVLPLCRAHLE